MRRSLALTLALSVVLALTGCSDDPPAKANTDAGDVAKPAASGPSAPAQKPADVPPGSRKTLSKKQAKAALLTVNDLPSGWAANKKADVSKRTTEPAGCAAVFNALDKAASPVAKAEVRFAQGTALVEHSLVSFKKDAEGLVTDTFEAFSKCSEFTSIEAGGGRYEAKLAPLSFPNLGDRTLAVRMTAAGDDEELVVDVILIAIGHNVIGLFAAGPLPVPGSAVTAMARRAVAKLG